jgi:hypothetical protein
MEGVKPYINLKVIGRVDKFVVDHVLKVLKEFYGRLEEDAKPEMVDVQVFEKRSTLLGFLTSASRGLEVTYPFDESYIAMHEAWTGIPKIHVCTEDLKRLPRPVFDAALRHEAAHSALHGSPEYYIVSIPASLAAEFRRQGFTDEEIKHLAYLEASALKDLEASNLLKNLGYVEDQIAFILHNLEMEKSDIAAWRIASTNPKATLIYLTHMLKALASSIPFLQVSQYGERLAAKHKEACSHINQKACDALEALGRALEKAEGNFHQKMVYLLKETLKLVLV